MNISRYRKAWSGRFGLMAAGAAAWFGLAGIGLAAEAAEEIGDLLDSKVEKIAEGFDFTEGPVWHPEGYLLFSDIPADTIYRADLPDGASTATISVFRKPSGKSNGLTLDARNRLLAAEHGNRRVSVTKADGESVGSLAEAFEGGKFNSPNDLAVHPSGRIYFTDPDYGLEGRPREQAREGVYRIDPDGAVHLEIGDMQKPNGLAFSPDWSLLYVASTTGSRVMAFDVAEDGSLANGRLFAEVGWPDGLKVDEAGRLWVTSVDGVVVLAPDGRRLGTVVMAEWAANCAFGGADRRSLFITARTGVYHVRVKTPGIAAGDWDR